MSTKAILDKNTNQCKGEWESTDFIQCSYAKSLCTFQTQILIWDFSVENISWEWRHTNQCTMGSGFVFIFPFLLYFFAFLINQCTKVFFFLQWAEMSVNRQCDIKLKQITETSHPMCCCTKSMCFPQNRVFLCGKGLCFYSVYNTTVLTAIMTTSSFNLSKWCTARVPLFCFTSLW